MANSEYPPVILHIGAHKTATTHLQRSVQAVRQDIWKEGVRFLAPQHLRDEGKSIADRFDLSNATLPKNKRIDSDISVTALRHDATRIVISEENFIGTLHKGGIKVDMPIYPKATDRIDELAEVVAPDGIDVFLGIRNPATFLNSAFSQYLLAGGTKDAKAFKRANPIEGVNWVDFVGRLTEANNVRSLIAWPYEEYEALFSRILALMFGQKAGAQVNWIDERAHAGLSRAAVEQIYAKRKSGKIKGAALAARKTFPANVENEPFDAYTGEEHAKSGVFYADQLQEIATMRQVTLLRP